MWTYHVLAAGGGGGGGQTERESADNADGQ